MENILGEKKKQWISIGMIYAAAVLVYAFAASRMSVPVHLLADEDICLSLAKSFHHSGSFMKSYEYSNYNCILYSVLVSIGYCFYTPETILFTIRSINVLVMCSAIFPVFLMAKRILPYKKAMMVSAFCMLLPDMIDSCYIMQEVLFFPVLMWCFFFVYRDLEEGRSVNRFCILAAVMMSVAFFVKTNGLILIAAYVLLLLAAGWKNKKKAIVKSLAAGGSWCAVTVLLELVIFLANGGNEGQNHYASQIMRLFPVSGYTVLAGLSGLLYYVVFFVFCVGILPAVIPLIYRKKYSEIDGNFLLFTGASIALMIAEIVVTIFLTEEAGNMVPHKFLFRYFFGFGIPLLILFLKLPEAELKGKKLLLFCYGGTGLYIAVYFLAVGTATRTSIMDSHITLLLENINKYVVPGFPVYCAVIFLVVSLIFVCFTFRKKNLEFLLHVFWKLNWTAAILLCVINLFQHPLYSNRIVNGETREPDFIKVAHCLGKNDVKVYFMSEQLDNGALLYGYIWQDYQWIYTEEEIDPEEDCVVVTAADHYEKINGFRKSELQTESIDLWIRQN